jgi:hypothetical protein
MWNITIEDDRTLASKTAQRCRGEVVRGFGGRGACGRVGEGLRGLAGSLALGLDWILGGRRIVG